jgi:hypothetical protein
MLSGVRRRSSYQAATEPATEATEPSLADSMTRPVVTSRPARLAPRARWDALARVASTQRAWRTRHLLNSYTTGVEGVVF